MANDRLENKTSYEEEMKIVRERRSRIENKLDKVLKPKKSLQKLTIRNDIMDLTMEFVK
jgi:hypothetical protein